MYDDRHRFHVISVLPDRNDSLEQKGLRQLLLCGDCETKVSRFEDYARRVLIGGTELEFRREGKVVTVDGVDYMQFKLFQLSILWRAGVSTLQMFERVTLGRFEEELRRMLLEEDPGDEAKFGCVMFGLKEDNAGATTDVIVQPMRIRIDGHVCYRFVFGGFMWVYFVSGRKPTGSYKVGFLQQSGRLAFVIKNLFEAKSMLNFAKERARLGRVK